MDPLVVINPRSQGGKTGQVADDLVRVLERYLGAVERQDTERPGHASDIAREAAEAGRPAVIAVGGDGTIHEIADGLLQAHGKVATLPTLGIVGQGTGGDFRRTLGLEHRLDRYCQAIAGGRKRRIDMGRFRYQDKQGEEATSSFINILSAGMGGLVDEYVAQASQRLGGTLAYMSASLRALVESEVGVLACRLHRGDEVEEREIATRNIAICNGRFFGSGMEVAPMAEPDDGWFDIVSLGAAAKAKFALSSLSIYSGKHVDRPEVEVYRCNRIDIELQNQSVRDKFLLDVDGEPLGKLPISVELVPGALEVFVPAGWPPR